MKATLHQAAHADPASGPVGAEGAPEGADATAPAAGAIAVSPAIGRAAARGVAAAGLQVVSVKVFNILAQLVLARLLMPKDFGLIGLAYLIAFLAGPIRKLGVREILVHRHASYRLWANAAFWMSLAAGASCALVMLLMAPVAARVYHDWRLVGLIAVLALSPPFESITIIPTARLQMDLRFGLLSTVSTIDQILLQLLTIAFALLGFGAYSFALPRPIIAVLELVIYWTVVRPPVRWNLQLHRWRFLFPSSSVLLLADLANTLTYQGDYLLLGMFWPPDVVGVYYMAYNLSLQTAQLVGLNFSVVLFPALSRLQNEEGRQGRAFLNAARAIAVIGVPLCVLQAAAAGPAVHVLLPPKWYPTVHLFQILSLGTAINLVGLPADSLIKANGRFRLAFALTGSFAVVFLTAVGLAAWLSGVTAVAIAVASVFSLFAAIQTYAALRITGRGLRELVLIFAAPALSSAAAGAAAYAASNAVPPMHGGHVVRLAVAVLVMFAVYLPLIWLTDRATVKDIVYRLRALLSRRGG